jgi:hypothetical protein
MNVFGAFSFGRLIKTFLPGFVVLMSIPLYVESVLLIANSSHSLLNWIYANAILASALAVPLSLIFGIISNIVFFTFLTDRLIRKPFIEGNQDFNKTQQRISEWITSHYEDKNLIPSDIFGDFKKYIDLDFFLLPQLQLDKLVFLQESYWYYLEFQLNLILSVIVFAIAILLRVSVYTFKSEASLCFYILFVILSMMFFVSVINISLKAAKINYDRHKRKLLSLQVGVIYSEKNGKNKKE